MVGLAIVSIVIGALLAGFVHERVAFWGGVVLVSFGAVVLLLALVGEADALPL